MNIKHLITACILPMAFTMYGVETEKEKATNSYSETASTTTTFDVSVGEMISFSIAKEHPGQAYLLKSETPSDNWLFIYHDRWGLSTEVKEEAYTLWKDLKNVNVLAIDLYDGKVARNSSQAMRL